MRCSVSVLAALLLALAAAGCDRKVAGGEADGAKIFGQVCSRCHGMDGEPSPTLVARYGVQNLRSPRVQEMLSDEQIRTQILEGSANKQMPAFRGALSDEQIDALIEHIRSFGTASE